MENSFNLLSSMSPKINKHQKVKKNCPSVLALKKHFRRSILLENADRTFSNRELNIVEGSTDSSSLSSGDLQTKSPNNNKKVPVHKNCLKKEKVLQIEQWLNNLKIENKENCGDFTELSTIFGDDASHYKTEGIGLAVHSSFANSQSKPFEKCFKKGYSVKIETNNINEEPNLDSSTSTRNKIENSIVVIDDSFELLLKDVTNTVKISPKNVPWLLEDNETNSEKKHKILMEVPLKSEHSVIFIEDSVNLSSNDNLPDLEVQNDVKSDMEQNSLNIRKSPAKTKDISLKLTLKDNGRGGDKDNLDLNKAFEGGSTKATLTPKVNSSVDSKNKLNKYCHDDLVNEKELEAVLDTIYGDSWRQNKEMVLPKSEPRMHTLQPKPYVPNTERKNSSVKTHPTNLLKRLQNEKPLSTHQKLYDSDTDDDQYDTLETITDRVKTKLTFDDDNDENVSSANKSSKNGSKKPRKNRGVGIIHKENLDLNFKKMSDIKNPTESISKKIIKPPNPLPKDTTSKKKREPTKSKNKGPPNQTKKGEHEHVKAPVKTSAPIVRSNSVATSVHRDSDDDDEWDKEISKIIESRRKTQQFPKTTYGFLESLSGNIPSDRCDPSARMFRSCYKQQKETLAKKLFEMYNEQVFDKCIPADAPLEWNDRLRGTAGTCHCRKITHRSGEVERTVKIVLSTKVLDSADRLRDTLLHELCHAATWIVNCVTDGHGSYWKSWAYKAMRTFPELPPIKRCHDYVINTKYVYKCVQCSYSIGRHTKSLDIERKRCGYCYGKFEVLINKTSKNGETRTVPVTPRKEPTAFAMFVKENYANHKNPNLKHGDVMKILGQKFSELKLKTS